MFELKLMVAADKAAAYSALEEQLRALLAGERDFVANAANTTALIYHALPGLNWAGFYRLVGDTLLLGPFQGKPACVRIPVGKGVCGTVAARREAVLAPNCRAFPGHIACDPASASELAVPLLKGGVLLGVLDLDSPICNRFDEADQAGLERLVAVFLESTDPATP
ncbi:MAG TPA: GAF domain-containing protein [Verrucomicrobiota bacterium]|nr:GAF domain-containing protein [Verrucomicrobiota bacterium]HNU53361.1 GAF domain-containing protein [Verrucomicrobiota bacterium]